MPARIADTVRESLKPNQISNLTIWINNTIPTDQKLKAQVIAENCCYWPAQNNNAARHMGETGEATKAGNPTVTGTFNHQHVQRAQHWGQTWDNQCSSLFQMGKK